MSQYLIPALFGALFGLIGAAISIIITWPKEDKK